MAHYAHYLRREVIEVPYEDALDPWFADNQPDDQGFDAPVYHMTRSTTGPATRVAAGDTIWLFSQLFTPWGKFPPALDAKITVRSVRNRSEAGGPLTPGFRYEADKDSLWFPLRDATTCIQQLCTKSAAGLVRPVLSHPKQPVGQALQRLRELANADLVGEWALGVEATPFEFISYRLIDGTRRACATALQFVNEGRAIFWDRWSLPRRLAERREFLNDDALNAYISSAITRCHTVWGICSPKYAAPGSYSARERREAKRLKKLQIL